MLVGGIPTIPNQSVYSMETWCDEMRKPGMIFQIRYHVHIWRGGYLTTTFIQDYGYLYQPKLYTCSSFSFCLPEAVCRNGWKLCAKTKNTCDYFSCNYENVLDIYVAGLDIVTWCVCITNQFFSKNSLSYLHHSRMSHRCIRMRCHGFRVSHHGSCRCEPLRLLRVSLHSSLLDEQLLLQGGDELSLWTVCTVYAVLRCMHCMYVRRALYTVMYMLCWGVCTACMWEELCIL